MPAQTLGAGLAYALKSRGVDTIFGIPGVHNVELYRGIEEAGITHVLARHEQGAGFMADGYARATGRPGVAFVISGPGLTNILTPLGQAYSDSVSVLAISSCLPSGALMPGQLHQMRDQLAAAASVCDWSHVAPDAESAYDLLDRAFGEFARQRARPKHLSVPVDVLGQPDIEAPAFVAKARPVAPDPDAVSQVADLLNAATKPLFIFGGGASNASDSARAVVETSGAGVFTSYAGRGVIAGTYALNFGATLPRDDRMKVIAGADLVVVVGSELAAVDLWRDALGHRAPMVRVDIDDTVLADGHKAEIRVRADAALFLRALQGHLTPSAPKWAPDYVATKRAVARAASVAETPRVAPFVDVMADVLPKDAMIYSDMTQFAYVAKEIFPMHAPGLWHHPYGFGTLGYALPAAIGGKIGVNKRPVIAIAGDYGFQYTMQELGVAAELALCLPIILWDNGKLKEIEDCMVSAQIAPNAVIAKNPDFASLAAAFRVGYEAPDGLGAFGNALGRALQAVGPTIIHIGP